MATTGRPGVYISENFTPLVTNTVLSGGALPCIVAAHPRGPIQPTLIQSWNQFVQLYGNFTQAPNSILPFAVYEFFNNGGSQLFVLRLPNSDATPAALTLTDIATSPTNALTVTSLSPGVWGEQIFISIVVKQSGYFDFNVYLGSGTNSSLVETFPSMAMDPANPRYCATMLNSPTNGSQYVNVTDLISGAGVPVGTGPFPDAYVLGSSDLAPTGPLPLTGGSDGSVAPVLGTVIPQWLDTLVNQVLIVNVPGLSDVTTLNQLIAWAGLRTDKFIVIDGPAPIPAALNATGYSTVCANEYISMVNSGSPNLTASSYAAIYAPWVLAQDPSSSVPGACRWLPPGPFMLGQYNSTDVARGAFVTPAGTKNTLKLISLETQFTQADLDNLNNVQVNAIKLVPGAGFCPFGGRTLSLGYPSRYISVRRMIMQLEHDFKTLLLPLMFEPNDYLLWRQITSILTNYLTQQMQIGALGGSTPTDTFQITCDATNNTDAMAAAGIVTTDVAVALLSPAEYININVTQFQGSGTTTVTTTAS